MGESSLERIPLLLGSRCFRVVGVPPYAVGKLCGSQGRSATLFPSCLELIVPFSISLSTRISRRESFERCGVIDLVPVDDCFFGSVYVRVFSLHVR